jgi:hypothetical protein
LHLDGALEGEVVKTLDSGDALLERQLVLEGLHVDLGGNGTKKVLKKAVHALVVLFFETPFLH